MSASVTAVDLSRLAPPAIVEPLSYEAILAAMVADLRARGPWDALVESDPAMQVLQVAAYRELLLRQDFNDRARSRLLAYARGSDLDHVAAPFGVLRLAGEADDAFLARILLAPDSYSVAGPEAAYVYHAKSASTDVLDASATSPAPGQVLVSLLSATGTGAASPALIAAVAAVVTARDVRPLTDLVTVQSAQILPYSIAATVYTYGGPDPAVPLTKGRAQLDAYVARCRRIGIDVTDSGIKAALHVDGVQRVVLPGWADVVCGETQAAWCTGIAITNGGGGGVSLLPPNAGRLARDLEGATARIGAVATPIQHLWDPALCPAALLPWLAWGLSIDRWETGWTEAEKRVAIAQAIERQRRKGTPASVEEVLAELDGLMQLVEWHEAGGGGTPHTFEIRYPLTGAPAWKRQAAWIEKIVREVTIVKPVRAHFRLAQQFVAGGVVTAVGAGRAMVAHRRDATTTPDTSQPWADLLQDDLGEPITDSAGLFLNGTP